MDAHKGARVMPLHRESWRLHAPPSNSPDCFNCHNNIELCPYKHSGSALPPARLSLIYPCVKEIEFYESVGGMTLGLAAFNSFIHLFAFMSSVLINESTACSHLPLLFILQRPN
jgi:hypothetical protein